MNGGVGDDHRAAAAQRDGRSLAGCDLPLPEMAVRTPQDLFRLMYTSGTTDRPKGVIHSYENFYWKSADHVLVLGLSRDDASSHASFAAGWSALPWRSSACSCCGRC